jgi:hypothetical protein
MTVVTVGAICKTACIEFDSVLTDAGHLVG